MKEYPLIAIIVLLNHFMSAQNNSYNVLDFNGVNGYEHQSKEAGLKLIENLD